MDLAVKGGDDFPHLGDEGSLTSQQIWENFKSMQHYGAPQMIIDPFIDALGGWAYFLGAILSAGGNIASFGFFIISNGTWIW